MVLRLYNIQYGTGQDVFWGLLVAVVLRLASSQCVEDACAVGESFLGAIDLCLSLCLL